MAEIDDRAFDNMKKATRRAPDRLFEKGRMFTESEYNTRATNLERKEYDSQAYRLLKNLYSEDLKKGRIKTLNFSQFLENLNNEYLEEKFIHPREDDPEYYREAGKLLRSTFADDVEQLKLSAYNVYGELEAKKDSDLKKDRSNISIKAPGAESY